MDAFKQALAYLFDLLFPPSEEERLAESATGEDVARAERAEPLPEPYLFAPFSYRNPTVRALIWTLKYRRRIRSAEVLAEALADALAEELSDRALFKNFMRPALIPMPLSHGRFRERGFNQCELLAKELVRHLPDVTILPEALRKIKETTPQTKLARRKEREENLAGAFAVKEADAVRGKNIILLDDVITTGSSMKEARAALLEAGARDVWCVAAAH